MDFDAYRRAYFVDPPPEPRFRFSNSLGATLYYQDWATALAFYEAVLGPPVYVEGADTRGWPIGTGWLTLLRGSQGNPRNVEVTLELDTVAEAEALQRAFIAAGARGPSPSDQLMYRPVRSCPVVDPFGLEIMIISPLEAEGVPRTTRSPEQPSSPDDRLRALYDSLLDRWNERDAQGFAGLFAPEGSTVGFDGSQMNGRQEIAAELERIFADHQTAKYVARVREVRLLTIDVALLRAVVGMVPPGQSDINPAANAVQSLVAARHGGEWRIALFHNTPAAYHGRPDLSQQLTDELRQALRSP